MTAKRHTQPKASKKSAKVAAMRRQAQRQVQLIVVSVLVAVVGVLMLLLTRAEVAVNMPTAASAKDALGVSVPADNNVDNYEKWIDRDLKFRMVIVHQNTGTDYTAASTHVQSQFSNFKTYINARLAAGKPGMTYVVDVSMVPDGLQDAKHTCGATTCNVTNIQNGINGDYDAFYRAVGNAIKANGLDSTYSDGRPKVVIRFGHEHNGDWYSWSSNNAEDKYAQLWRRAHGIIRGITGPNVLWEWNLSYKSNIDDNTGPNATLQNAYPGNAYVDIIGLDFYDRSFSESDTFCTTVSACPPFASVPSQPQTKIDAAWTSQVKKLDGFVAFAASKGKKLGVSEWGASATTKLTNNTPVAWKYGGNNPNFINKVYEWAQNITVAGSAANKVLAYMIYFERGDVDSAETGSSGIQKLSPGSESEVPDQPFVLKYRFGSVTKETAFPNQNDERGATQRFLDLFGGRYDYGTHIPVTSKPALWGMSTYTEALGTNPSSGDLSEKNDPNKGVKWNEYTRFMNWLGNDLEPLTAPEYTNNRSANADTPGTATWANSQSRAIQLAQALSLTNPPANARTARQDGKQRPLVLGLPLLLKEGGTTTLRQIADGDRDSYYTAIRNSLIHEGLSDTIFRLGWEANCNCYEWGVKDSETSTGSGASAVYTGGQTQDALDYIAAYRHVVDVIRGTDGKGDNFEFVFDTIYDGYYNKKNSKGVQRTISDADALYPGKRAGETLSRDYVDYIGMDIYDSGAGGVVGWNKKHKVSLDALAAFAAIYSKPIVIPEWATVAKAHGGGGDDDIFYTNMLTWINSHPVAWYQLWNRWVPLKDGPYRVYPAYCSLPVLSADAKSFTCNPQIPPALLYPKAATAFINYLVAQKNGPVAPSNPAIGSFMVSSTSVTTGANVTFTWTSSHTSGTQPCKIDSTSGLTGHSYAGLSSAGSQTSTALINGTASPITGVFTLTCTGASGTVAATATVSVSVAPSATNTRPVITLGTSWTATTGISKALSATVTDDGLPNPPAAATSTWSVTTKPTGATVTFTPNGSVAAKNTTAVFSKAGTYSLQIAVTDSALTTTATTTVVVSDPADTTAPVVSWVSPASGTNVRGTVALTTTATDANGIQKVEFYSGGASGTLLATVTSPTSGSTYTTSWDTTSPLINGAVSVVAKAYDTTGNTSITPGTTLVIDNTAPTATFSAPSADAVTSGIITVSATASDPSFADGSSGSGVKQVEFYIDGTATGNKFATDLTAPYTGSLTTTSYTGGVHALYTKVTDQAGNVFTSTGHSFVIDNTDPSGSFSISPTPVLGAPVPNLLTLDITADGTGSGVAQVELFRTGKTVRLAVKTRPEEDGSYKIVWNTTNVVSGDYGLSIKITDLAGRTYTTPLQTVTILNDGSSGAPDTEAPTTPGGLDTNDSSPPSESTISLLWLPSTDNVGVVGYRIYRENILVADKLVADDATTTYLDINLVRETSYDYQVVAYDEAGNESDPATITVQTEAPYRTADFSGDGKVCTQDLIYVAIYMRTNNALLNALHDPVDRYDSGDHITFVKQLKADNLGEDLNNDGDMLDPGELPRCPKN